MYPSVRGDLPAVARAEHGGSSRWTRVSRNVILLGVTSLFTDISSEMLAAVLPLYFMLEVGMSPLQFGLIDGLYQGTSALVRVASGMWADAGTRYKHVATIGYALSAVCKIALLAVGARWLPIAALVMLDRLGKGIRTAPRDALITLSSDKSSLGEAFGVHRALDTIGAVLGPLVAFGVLAAAPGAYDAVFVISFAIACVGLAVITLFVENRRRELSPDFQRANGRPRLLALVRNRAFSTVVVAGGALGLMTASDALIYLLIQRRASLPATMFPLLFVGTAMAYFVLALPFGRLADRLGRHRLFLAGHAFVALAYALLLRSHLSTLEVLTCVALLGAYYAATDGVLPALASTVLPVPHLTTGLAVVSTVVALARLVAASIFGAIWTWWGANGVLIAFTVGLLAAMASASTLLRVSRPWPGGQTA